MLNIRSKNIVKELLKGSECLFAFSSDKGFSDYDLLNKLEGVIQNNKLFSQVVIPHGQIDAFGGLSLLSSYAKNTLPNYFNFQFQHEDKSCFQETIEISSVKKQNNCTFTQLFIKNSLEVLQRHNIKNIALPIALEDATKIKRDELYGNSFIIVLLSIEKAEAAALLNKEEWKSLISKKAEYAYQFIKDNPSAAKPLDNTLLISSVGNIEDISWASHLNGTNFSMIPTPINPTSANLVLWGNNNVQTLGYSSFKSSGLELLGQELAIIWRETFEYKSL